MEKVFWGLGFFCGQMMSLLIFRIVGYRTVPTGMIIRLSITLTKEAIYIVSCFSGVFLRQVGLFAEG